MRRWLAPLVLAASCIGSGAVAATVLPVEHPSVVMPSPEPTAAVLSPRRVPAVLARTIADARLRSALDRVLADRSIGEARNRSCLVVRRQGRDLYSRGADVALLPASNVKLLTATAALSRLGVGARYVTDVRAGAPPRGGVIDGPLWLVGGGDPLLATAPYLAGFKNQPQVHTPMEELVRAIVAAGVREVRGGVVGDESRYDRIRYIPTWKPSYLTDAEVGPAGALVVNDGFASFTPRKVASSEPALHAAQVLTEMLRAAGVTVAAPPAVGKVAGRAVSVARVESPPVGEVVGEMLRESDNLTAEMLVKELGWKATGEGTTAAGLRALRAALVQAGLPAADLLSVDGSGLDRSDRATCRLLIETLVRAGPASAIDRGLAVAGRTGTLARRFAANPAAGRLRAKTGALDGAVGLTGWMPLPGGDALAFSLMANGIPTEAAGRALQERLGAALATYPDTPPIAALAPPDS